MILRSPPSEGWPQAGVGFPNSGKKEAGVSNGWKIRLGDFPMTLVGKIRTQPLKWRQPCFFKFDEVNFMCKVV